MPEPLSPVYCPACQTRYRVVRAEAGPETAGDDTVACKTCGGPLPARDGQFVLKYFRVSPRRSDVRGGDNRRTVASRSRLSD